MKKIIPNDSVLIPDSAAKVYEGNIFDVYHWHQHLFDESSAIFEMLKRDDTISAICVVDNKLIVLDEQQPRTDVYKVFPSGRINTEDNSILEGAQREVQEETGYTYNNWRLIKATQPYGKIEWFVYIFIAWDVKAKQEQSLDAGEKITVNLIDFDEVKNLITSKVNYLGDSKDLFDNINSIEDLLNLPEYEGKIVDR